MTKIFAALALLISTVAMAETSTADHVTLACSGTISISGPDHQESPMTGSVEVDFPNNTVTHSFFGSPCTISDYIPNKGLALQCMSLNWKTPSEPSSRIVKIDGWLDRITGQFYLWGRLDPSHLAFIINVMCSAARPIF